MIEGRRTADKKMKKTTPANLDLETTLWTEILARLPVKPLVRFRLVSKTWCSVIDNPAFASMHLKLYKNNSEKNHIFAFKISSRPNRSEEYNVSPTDYIVSSTTTTTTNSDDSTELEFNQMPQSANRNPYGLRGLFLIFRRCLTMIDSDCTVNLAFWNPSIRKELILPTPADIPFFHHCNKLALGFDPSSRDYKVLALETDFCLDYVDRFAIYSHNWKSWKTKTIPKMDQRDVRGMNYGQVYAQGSVYWSENYNDPLKYNTYLVSFDFVDEEFTHVPLPDSVNINRSEVVLLHFALGELLGLLELSRERSFVWEMRKGSRHGEVSWSKWYESSNAVSCSESYECFQGLIDFKKCKDIYVMLFVEKSGKLLFGDSSKKIYSYDIKTHEIDEVKKYDSVSFLRYYYESLVLL